MNNLKHFIKPTVVRLVFRFKIGNIWKHEQYRMLE